MSNIRPTGAANDVQRVVVKFKKQTLILNFKGDSCTVRYVQKKKPSASWKKLVGAHRRSNGVRTLK